MKPLFKSAEKKLLMEEIRRSFSHYLQGFGIHPRWLFGISNINSVSMLSNTLELVKNLPVNKK